jgi:molecular chaperone GrpE
MGENPDDIPEIEILSSQAEKYDDAGPHVPAGAPPGGEADMAEVPVAPESEEWKKKHDEMKDRLMWMAADFDNYKKRVLKEKEEFLKFSQENLLKGVLPVLDNLERALAVLRGHEQEATPAFASMKQGVEMVLRQFWGVLEKHGVTKIKAVGEKFDPRVHEVMTQEESSEHPDETVLEELLSGYMIHDRVLRPSQVKISKTPTAT